MRHVCVCLLFFFLVFVTAHPCKIQPCIDLHAAHGKTICISSAVSYDILWSKPSWGLLQVISLILQHCFYLSGGPRWIIPANPLCQRLLWSLAWEWHDRDLHGLGPKAWLGGTKFNFWVCCWWVFRLIAAEVYGTWSPCAGSSKYMSIGSWSS